MSIWCSDDRRGGRRWVLASTAACSEVVRDRDGAGCVPGGVDAGLARTRAEPSAPGSAVGVADGWRVRSNPGSLAFLTLPESRRSGGWVAGRCGGVGRCDIGPVRGAGVPPGGVIVRGACDPVGGVIRVLVRLARVPWVTVTVAVRRDRWPGGVLVRGRSEPTEVCEISSALVTASE